MRTLLKNLYKYKTSTVRINFLFCAVNAVQKILKLPHKYFFLIEKNDEKDKNSERKISKIFACGACPQGRAGQEYQEMIGIQKV